MKNKFCPRWDSNPRPIRGKRLTANVEKYRLCWKILSRYFHISLGVVCSLPWGPRGLAVKRLPRMQEVVGSNPTEGKIWFYFLHFTLVEWNVKNCFVKLIKTLNKKIISSEMTTFYWKYLKVQNFNQLWKLNLRIFIQNVNLDWFYKHCIQIRVYGNIISGSSVTRYFSREINYNIDSVLLYLCIPYNQLSV